MKTLYDNLEGNKENKKPPKGKDSKTKENEEKKKQQKQQQQQQQQTEKKKEIPKEKPPKSIEDALRMVKYIKSKFNLYFLVIINIFYYFLDKCIGS